jgi:HD-GYP domain-containing protein (c-di-GMP phosphodiesterase class II)
MTTESLDRAAVLRGKLQESFATPVWLWSPSEGWLTTMPLAAGQWLDESSFLALLSRGIPVVETSSDARTTTMLLPLPIAPRRSWLAVAHFEQISPDWVRRLAETYLEAHRLTLQCHDLQEQVGAAMSQISSDFEQQTYLRFLAEQIELCDVSRDVSHVVDRLLPRLQRVISASSVIFVPTLARQVGIQAAGWSSLGMAPVSKSMCLDLIDRYDAELFRGPVVRNRGFSAHGDDLPPAISSFMMVAVEKETSSVGWLLAFNRHPNFVAENEIDNGFGTVEAGLLQVTSVMVATHGRNVALFKESEDLTVEVVRTLVNAIEARDSYTRGHSERVGKLAQRLSQQLGLSTEYCEQIYVAGLLHDIGKIGVSDQILRKEGRLTPEEFDEIKKHPAIGYEILRGLGKLAYVLPGVLHHHERLDGQGYPHGLAGESIPAQARILAVADSWDAMTSARPYRQAMPFAKAENILNEGSGSQWDPAIIRSFQSMIEDAKSIALSHAVSEHVTASEEMSPVRRSLESIQGAVR